MKMPRSLHSQAGANRQWTLQSIPKRAACRKSLGGFPELVHWAVICQIIGGFSVLTGPATAIPVVGDGAIAPSSGGGEASGR